MAAASLSLPRDVIAVFDFTAPPGSANVHSFKAGDRLTLTVIRSVEWAEGYYQGRPGIFPLPFCRELNIEELLQSTPPAQPASSPPPPSPATAPLPPPIAQTKSPAASPSPPHSPRRTSSLAVSVSVEKTLEIVPSPSASSSSLPHLSASDSELVASRSFDSPGPARHGSPLKSASPLSASASAVVSSSSASSLPQVTAAADDDAVRRSRTSPGSGRLARYSTGPSTPSTPSVYSRSKGSSPAISRSNSNSGSGGGNAQLEALLQETQDRLSNGVPDAGERTALVQDFFVKLLVAHAPRLGTVELKGDTSLSSLGLSSRDATQLKSVLLERFGVKLSIMQFVQLPSIRALSEVIADKLGPGPLALASPRSLRRSRGLEGQRSSSSESLPSMSFAELSEFTVFACAFRLPDAATLHKSIKLPSRRTPNADELRQVIRDAGVDHPDLAAAQFFDADTCLPLPLPLRVGAFPAQLLVAPGSWLDFPDAAEPLPDDAVAKLSSKFRAAYSNPRGRSSQSPSALFLRYLLKALPKLLGLPKDRKLTGADRLAALVPAVDQQWKIRNQLCRELHVSVPFSFFAEPHCTLDMLSKLFDSVRAAASGSPARGGSHSPARERSVELAARTPELRPELAPLTEKLTAALADIGPDAESHIASFLVQSFPIIFPQVPADTITLDAPVASYGLASADIIQYKNTLSDHINIQIPTLVLFSSSTLAELAAKLAQLFRNRASPARSPAV